ncbi:MAG: ribonuclease Z [Chitinophagales bacterium]
MDLQLTILGSNSATPAYGRHPSAQILHHHNTQYLIDCGEGTQFQMSKYHIKRKNLDYIFISHLHGDHYFGLVGLLNTLRLNGRTRPLHLFGFQKLWEILDVQMDFANTDWSYELVFHPLSYGKSEKILNTELIEVYTIPLTHGIDCNGFLFKEKEKPRKIIAAKIEEYNIPYQKINTIKIGEDFVTEDGKTIPNSELTKTPPPSKSFAYCSDTMYNEKIIPHINKVDMLYHETTFLKEDTEKAKLRNHSTTTQAAQIAEKAKVKKLIIGHFSARYKDVSSFKDEAKEVFNNVDLAIEGSIFKV